MATAPGDTYRELADKKTAYVEDDRADGSTEPRYYAGVPGVWIPGEAQAIHDIDPNRSAAEWAELVKASGVPLKKTTATPKHAEDDLSLRSSATRSRSLVGTRAAAEETPVEQPAAGSDG